MSYKVRLLKLAIKLMPVPLVLWVANIVLKNIAELKRFSVDIDARTVYVEVKLYGEPDAIQVWLEDFCIASDQDQVARYFILQQARSNKPWLANLLGRFTGKYWKIPEIPQYGAQLQLAAELLEPRQ